MKTPELEKIQCWNCSTYFEWNRTAGDYAEPRLCQSCAAQEIQKKHSEAQRKVDAAVLKLTPPRFQATDPAHPAFNLKLWERVKTWRPTSEFPWLGMVGETGLCKTRCAFLLMREIVAGMIRPAGHPNTAPWMPPSTAPWVPIIATVTGYEFGGIVLAQFGDGKTDAGKSLQRLRRADVLLIDDLGKQRNTPAVSSELFGLINHRYTNNLATIWTSNATPEAIVAGTGEDMASPIAGRIRECSTIINLCCPPEQKP